MEHRTKCDKIGMNYMPYAYLEVIVSKREEKGGERPFHPIVARTMKNHLGNWFNQLFDGQLPKNSFVITICPCQTHP